jgi:predicted nucleotidyltransferase
MREKVKDLHCGPVDSCSIWRKSSNTDKNGVIMKSFKSVSLMKNESDAIKAAIKMLKSEFSVSKVILFGSKARGDHDEHSDIDLLVVASKLLHWKEEKAIVGALFDIGMKYDVIFSPLFTFVDEWENGIFTKFPVYQEISRDGAVVS